jgi:hypothetical protein
MDTSPTTKPNDQIDIDNPEYYSEISQHLPNFKYFSFRVKTAELTQVPTRFKFLGTFCTAIIALIIYLSLEASA